ncbi:TonB-dependent receptor, partial [Parabacteroides goldsteinii]|uniref:TonB-dependent receptor n=1 Tax=Parabacteroides goldsteinii TaxID=328812 RepID=UPI0025702CA7
EINAGASIFNPASITQIPLLDWAVEDGAFLRVNNISIGYTLPKALTSKAKIERLRFYFSGDNLLTITKFPQGGDPERNYNSTKGTRLVYYPQNRIISFGVNLEF